MSISTTDAKRLQDKAWQWLDAREALAASNPWKPALVTDLQRAERELTETLKEIGR